MRPTIRSNGELLAETVQAGQKEVDTAVAAARTAFESWSKTPGVNHTRYMYTIARNVQKHHRLLAVLELDGQWQANPRVA